MARLLAAERQIRAGASPPSRTCRPPGSAPGRCPRSRARARGRCCSSPSRRRRCPCSRPSAFSCRAHISMTASPSTIVPALVDEDGAVAVAVEGDAEPVAARRRRAATSRSRMRRPAREVDVPAVGRVADDVTSKPELAEQPRRDGGRGAVGAIDGDARRRGSARRPAAIAAQVLEVPVHERPRRAPASASPGGTRQDASATIASTCRSSSSVNFSPPPENTLMPLSSNGLCDAEMTTPRVKSLAAREVRDGRRRHDAGAHDVRAARARAVRELPLDPVARFARVASDETRAACRRQRTRRAPRRGAAPSA